MALEVDERSGLPDGRGQRAGQAAGGRLLTPRGLRTRAVLVAAAKQVFEQIPFAESRITDITTAAGVASGTFYTYFDSKEEIFREVAAAVLGEMSEAIRRDPDNVERDLIRDIEYASRQFFLVCVRNPGIVRSIEQVAPGDSEVATVRRSTVINNVKRGERWIRRLQAAGICDDIDPWKTAMALHTMNVRLAYDHLLTSTAGDDLEADIDELARTVTHIWARTVGLERVEPRTAPDEPSGLAS
ncbi:MAG TPA: TetR/AcrR family transcriptional regulator [Acidimicrobiales bacterium]|nr:TetR/AcrR family transcriptional regulator [Acidimicrobiales bacterium]